jgi:2-pyrone-4,6-dicarboxylate lactonase
VEITGPERVSRSGPPFHDAVPFARRLIETAPDRVLWGTDWPHPNVPFMPNDGDLMDLVARYAPEETLRRRLLVDNPARLFKFPA